MNQQSNIPPVRSIPVWDPQASILVKGFELEALTSGLGQIQLAQQALQSVISRSIVDGVINLDFEKYNPETNEYVPMTAEEKAPYLADVELQRQKLRNPTEQAKVTSPILNQDGLVQPSATEGKVETPVKEPKAKKAPKAKVVEGNFAKEVATEAPVYGDKQA